MAAPQKSCLVSPHRLPVPPLALQCAVHAPNTATWIRYLQGDDVPSPEVDVDGVQGGWQRHPLPLAVDGWLTGSCRWGREAAKGLYWHLEGDVALRRMLGRAEAPHAVLRNQALCLLGLHVEA